MLKQTYKEVNLDDRDVICVDAISFPEGIKEAWKKLEEPLEKLAGRKYYGISKCIEGKMYYAACATINEGDDKFGMKQITIKGGKYISLKMDNWQERIPEIGKNFGEMERSAEVDAERYYIEWYRSETELILYLPVK